MRTGTTLRKATEEWVQAFNAIPYGMIDKLIRNDPDEWHEVTTPSYGELANANEIVDGWLIFDNYQGTAFTNDDFVCTAGTPQL